MENYYKEMSDLVSKAYEMSDEELGQKCKELFSKIPSNISVHSASLDRLLAKRVSKYCMINKIPVTEYKGPLPYRQFKIQINNDKGN